MFINITLF